MKKIVLKNTSLELGNVCLGGSGFGHKRTRDEVFEVLDAFTEAGGNFIDTANVYCKWVEGLGNCSERLIGEWMKERGAHNRVVVATKGGHYNFDAPGVSRVNLESVKQDLDESRKSLGLEHIDFYWLHRDDESKPIGEIIDMMEGFVKEGSIRYYGASNYKLERMKAATAYAADKGCQGFSAVSNRWSLAMSPPSPKADSSMVAMSDEYLRWHRASGMPSIPYSASAHGFFEKLYRLRPRVSDGALHPEDEAAALAAGFRSAQLNGRNIRNYERLLKLKGDGEYSVHAYSLAYLLNQPFDVIAVSSVSSAAQLNELFQASELEFDSGLLED